MLRAVKERPAVQAAFAGLTWFPATVNLREVLAFQKIINTEGLESRLTSARTSKEGLFELCLPENQPLPLFRKNKVADSEASFYVHREIFRAK
jgi:hypothetical protein